MAEATRERRRPSLRRLIGLDRSGPEPPQTRAGQPLRPFTAPNMIGYLRLAAIPVFLVIALGSEDGRDAVASLIFLAIALGDLLDGFIARATGQYSRLGALLDPVIDRITILSGALVCWQFDLLPRPVLALLAVREVVTLILARYGLRHGVDLEITWVGRIAVFLIMGGIFWSMVLDWLALRVAFTVGVGLAIAATLLYVRAARHHRASVGRTPRAPARPAEPGC